MREERDVYKILVGKPGRRRQPEIPRHRWEDDIKVELQDIEWVSVEWIYLRQVMGSCDCGNELSGSIKFGEFLD
jgi:hypothetical protein